MSHRLWPSLERIPGAAAVLAEWRLHLEDDFESVGFLLQPTGREASCYPSSSRDDLTYRVVKHGEGDYVAVSDGDLPSLSLSKREVLVYKLDRLRLARQIATGLKVDPMPESVAGLPQAFQIGNYCPLAGYRFPVFLTFPWEVQDLPDTVGALLARNLAPFVLTIPTSNSLRSSCESLLKSWKCCVLPLDQCIDIGADSNWMATDVATRVLSEFQLGILPDSAEQTGMKFFPTPSDASWSKLRIRFVDGHSVTVSIGTVTRTLNYTQMGMVDGRSAGPTTQWELLRSLARGHGSITWTSPSATRKNQKRRERLASHLKKFFRIEGVPIVGDGGGWRTVFSLEPEN